MQAVLRILLLPFRILAIASGAKSFADNPVLGNAWLNRQGLHRLRCRLAARMADWRRQRLALRIDAAEREQFARSGFIRIDNFLPPAEFAALQAESLGQAFPSLEMRQGRAVTRRVLLDADPVAAGTSALARIACNRRLKNLICYVAGTDGAPLMTLQAIVTRESSAGHDPQTDPHIDTFHATAKAWLFLHDVGPDDGPFFYVPGSHRRTPARLDWEYRESLTAAAHPLRYHARGSLRLRVDELPLLGLPPPQAMTVRANTLVVADTSGLHGRTPSAAAGVRMEVYASMRRNPFLPWLGLQPGNVGWLQARSGRLGYRVIEKLAQRGIHFSWKPVGKKRLDDA